MDDELALLKAIYESKHDELRKLVYADWLDEHGDPAFANQVRMSCYSHPAAFGPADGWLLTRDVVDAGPPPFEGTHVVDHDYKARKTKVSRDYYAYLIGDEVRLELNRRFHAAERRAGYSEDVPDHDGGDRGDVAGRDDSGPEGPGDGVVLLPEPGTEQPVTTHDRHDQYADPAQATRRNAEFRTISVDDPEGYWEWDRIAEMYDQQRAEQIAELGAIQDGVEPVDPAGLIDHWSIVRGGGFPPAKPEVVYPMLRDAVRAARGRIAAAGSGRITGVDPFTWTVRYTLRDHPVAGIDDQ